MKFKIATPCRKDDVIGLWVESIWGGGIRYVEVGEKGIPNSQLLSYFYLANAGCGAYWYVRL